MSNRLKAITTKAKALYKTGKYKKWTDAIKAASKLTSSKIGAVKKKTAPKKKTATKKAAAKSYHKDTNSHNVKISVMSGAIGSYKDNLYKEIKGLEKTITEQTELLNRLKSIVKTRKNKSMNELTKMDIKTIEKNFLPHNKKLLRSLKLQFKKSI